MIDKEPLKGGIKHIFVTNSAFRRLTGIKKVCMMCGTNDPKMRCEPKRETIPYSGDLTGICEAGECGHDDSSWCERGPDKVRKP